MKTALLDTSFILACVAQKIDFFEYLHLEGFHVLIPRQVIGEITGLLNSKKIKERESANIALKLIKKNDFEEIDLKTKNVDRGIINYANSHEDIVVGALDREIKKNVAGQKVIIRGRKKLEII
ncbi:MAG TPA: hypothetical protein VJ208_02420 [Candidatus Nanoarchaeia archaeon]|nr:hypothetical protein [Candidatus Nanoarchaeia archaeon]